jgi:hypothetical protein
VSDYVPEQSAGVTIGVCGEQGSGKTVFLTCIFQSIWTAFPDDVVLDFDRDEIGNADYFRDNEDRIIARGRPDDELDSKGNPKPKDTQGTSPDVLVPARIYVKPYAPLPSTIPQVLSVDIKDFAGGHFRSLANLKDLGTPKDSDSDSTKARREVNETIKTADAFVILINSKEIDPLNETPQRNPFSPSVNFLLAHCRTEKKPVALLFSQIDQTKMLTDEVFWTLPRVQAFERQFTSNHGEAATGKPFGIVKRIACYETVEGDLAPIRQTLDGSIWKPEPAQVVLELLRAAMPRINQRLREAAEAARRKKEQDELETKRRRARRIAMGIGATVAILLIVGLAVLWQRLEREKRKLQLLTSVEARIAEGQLASISSETQSSLGHILSAYRADRSGTSPAIRTEIHNIHTAFAEAAQRLIDQPALDPAYSAELVRFQSLAPLLDPENTAPWRPTLLPLLEERAAFLSDWFARQERERTLILDEAIRHFSTGDERFARVLAAQSSRERPSQISVWRRHANTSASMIALQVQ